MVKALKIIASLIGILILALAIAIIIVTKVINPNDYKARAEQYVYNATGRHLHIGGQIQWSFFPWIGLNIPQVTIGNPTGITGPNFATIKNLEFKVRLLSLLTGKIEINDIQVENADINLIIENNKLNNWQKWQVNQKPDLTLYASLTQPPITQPLISEKRTLPIRAFSLKNLTVKNSTIHIINHQTNNTMLIKQVNLSVKDFDDNKKFPILLDFAFLQGQSTNVLQSHLKAIARINLATQHLYFPSLIFNGKLIRPNLPKIIIQVNSKSDLNFPARILNFNNLAIRLANMYLQGNAAITNLLHSPNIHVKLKSQNTEIGPLLDTLYGKNSFTGVMNLYTDLYLQVISSQQILNHLSGTGNIIVNNGVIKGVNIENLLNQALAYINKQPQPVGEPNAETAFSNIKASYIIHNGVLQNNDLQLTGKQLSATGMGVIDFVNKSINYKIIAQYNIPSTQQVQQFSLPITVSGTMDSLKFVPDFTAIAQKFLQQQINNFINEKAKNFNDTLKKLIH